MHAQIVQLAQRDLDQALRPELDGIAVTRLLLRGDPAQEIVKTARDRNAGLIVMSTHGHGPFYRFLLGSVTAKVLHESHCPVWTGAHLEEAPTRWSSARAHVLGPEAEEFPVLDWSYWRERGGAAWWKEMLSHPDDLRQWQQLKRATYAGAPLGPAEFVEEMERRFGRQWLHNGRPQGNPAKAENGTEATAPISIA